MVFPSGTGKPLSGSFSRRFTSENWKAKLAEVHRNTWTQWETFLKEEVGYRCRSPQTPGVISEETLARLEAKVSELPPQKKYAKTK